MDNNPGRNDWVMGNLAVRRRFGRADTYPLLVFGEFCHWASPKRSHRSIPGELLSIGIASREPSGTNVVVGLLLAWYRRGELCLLLRCLR